MQSANPPTNRVVSNGQMIPDENRQSVTEPNAPNGSLRRKGSFSFLRRSKSRERSASTSSTPARKLSKKDRAKMREKEMMQEQLPERPPRVPLVPRAPDLPTFGGEDESRPDSVAIMSNRAEGTFQRRLAQKQSHELSGSDVYRGMPIPPVPPIPPIPGHTPVARMPTTDPFAQEESMAHRGRYSYASSAISTINSPRKIRRRKDPTPFNLLVLGARGSGKTAFLNFLRDSLALPLSKRRQSVPGDDFDMPVARNAFPNFISHFAETEVGTERIGVTLWDSDGLEKNMVDLQLKEITNFIESKFENTYTEESKVARTPGFRDTHIHCTFLILDPSHLEANITAQAKANEINGVKAKANSFVKARPEPTTGGLNENLDLNLLRALKGKTTVVPVIAKADTVTTAQMAHLKRAVWDSLKQNGLETLEALEQDDDEGSETSREEDYRPKLKALDEEKPARKIENGPNGGEEDKFSVTSHLDSPSDSSSEFSASEFDLAKPGKPTGNRNRGSSPTHPSPERREPTPPVDPPLLPLSIISPDPYDTTTIGRKFAWGVADPYNKEHCDFQKLKTTVFREWRHDLTEASRELWYESWRTSRLNKKARRQGTISLGLNEVKTSVWAER